MFAGRFTRKVEGGANWGRSVRPIYDISKQAVFTDGILNAPSMERIGLEFSHIFTIEIQYTL